MELFDADIQLFSNTSTPHSSSVSVMDLIAMNGFMSTSILNLDTNP